ncbi:MAG TPA: dienelactone hydrolase family protein [Rhizomicrobium sp.]|jgi:carboxymethylenebutenolidase|nr:dienelactone hydrolase family protein [Rhizomicrobium sp.]
MNDDSHIITRRAFATTSLVAGFTLAAGQLRAGAIVTDAAGLVAGEVKVPVSDGIIPGYRARPAAASHWPVVLVTQEIFGIHEHIRDICRRFARLGCYAIAPSLYARYGDPGQYTDIHKLVMDVVSKVPDAEVMSDLDAAAKFAGSEGADAARLSIIGFCWGGRIVWLYAAHNPALKAAAAFYGALRAPTPRNPLRPLYPLDLAAKMNAPVIAFYGAKDDGIPVADVEAMRAALAQAGKRDWHIDVFMDTGHGFFADYRPSYNEADAKLAWSRTLDWFRQHHAM